MRIALFLVILFFANSTMAKNNLVVITIDGLRWQEIFTGADKQLIENKNFVEHPDQLKYRFWAESPEQRRVRLMPFFWNTLAKQGSIIGNRHIGSNMSVTNTWNFSYPGYNEIFTGTADKRIDSNKKVPNPNVSVIEYLNGRPEFGDNLAVFAGWDVFPAIFNVERSGLYVNAGFMSASGPHTPETLILNQLQQEIPSPWHNVRLDAFTYRFAKHYMLTQKPRVLTIAFGETDDFAHDGHYDHYLRAAHRTDQFLADLWRTLQSTPFYRNNTTMLITTDHGRGNNPEQWQHHASRRAIKGYLKSLNRFPQGIVGSNHIWLAALGPRIKSSGQIVPTMEIKQNQVAATILTILNEDPNQFSSKIGAPISEILHP